VSDEPGFILNRRELLSAVSAASVGAFLIPSAPRIAEATEISTRARRIGQYQLKVYSAHEYATVQSLVDYLIPKDDKSGSATDAGVPEFMDTMLDLEPGMRTAHRGGLAWLDHESRRRFNANFIDATDAQRRQILDDLAWPAKSPAAMATGMAWFNSFRDFTASGFFTSELGVEYLGYIGNTAVPEWTGCPPDALARLGVKYP
jgi:gluconate 2-dehydrogenase gamma chain